MNNLIIYSLEVAVSLALFYTAYWLFLKNETFFKLNRFYLLLTVVVSALIPIMNFTINGNSFINRYLISPITQYEQSLIGKNVFVNNATTASTKNLDRIKAAKSEQAIEKTASSEGQAASSPQASTMGEHVNWLSIALLVYAVGALLFLIRFLSNFVWIFIYVIKNRAQEISGTKIIRSESDISPFSFLRYIFIGPKEYASEELEKIISHEKIHIKQKHTVDLILLELLMILQWFNPFMWLYKRAVKINHEYLADEGTLDSGIEPNSYHYSLVNQVLSENNFEMSNSYGLSVQKRIAMMVKRRSPKFAALKITLALPVFIFLFAAFGFHGDVQLENNVVPQVMPRDSSIKEVSVPVEYLRLLQGEYQTTKGKWRDRTIIYTELLGYLYGFDDGYTYKIIPVGGESFVNPDDKASLVFNSKDKNNISLSLFGQINLVKQPLATGTAKPQKRSLAFTAANVMLSRGVSAGISYFKTAKDSAHYILTENDVNYAGYSLMQSEKLKEAAAMFKLNTELFPNSWNTYDSYAESLLKLGEKKQAIENYKKSLELNPGSKSAHEHLKELGVNTAGLIKEVKVPEAELNLIAGDYLSTNQKNWVRWIRFELTDGVLYGNDNGYRYKLIPMGNGKFVNPDDGASLIFNTRDQQAITLSLFGTINLKKVKTAKASEVELTKYAGLYLPLKGDTIQKPAEILVRDNKIFRMIPSDPDGPNKLIELKMVTATEFFYTDRSGRSIEFVVNDKNHVTHFILRRFEATYKLVKQ